MGKSRKSKNKSQRKDWTLGNDKQRTSSSGGHEVADKEVASKEVASQVVIQAASASRTAFSSGSSGASSVETKKVQASSDTESINKQEEMKMSGSESAAKDSVARKSEGEKSTPQANGGASVKPKPVDNRDYEKEPMGARIKVVGIGGGGNNAVNNMITSHLEGVEFVACNTDAQSLHQCLTERRIQLGNTITQGLGAGARLYA